MTLRYLAQVMTMNLANLFVRKHKLTKQKGLTYQVTGGVVGLDDNAALVGFAGATYRQLMRSGFAAFAKSTESGVDMDNQTTVISVNCQDLLGLLDSPERKDTILLGKPL